MRRDDEDDRAGGGESWIDHVVIPDDLSALDAEVRALRRERRVRARRARLRRLVNPRGVTGPLVIVVLLMVAGMASLLMLFQPRRPATSPAAPLATSGRNDGLLPDLRVTLPDGSSRALRDYRPAVLALAPIGCDCDPALREVGTAAVRHGVPFLLVDRSVPPLPAGLAPADAVRLAEPTGALAGEYGAETAKRRTPGGPVLVLVGADGRVVRLLDKPIAEDNFVRELEALDYATPAPTG